MAKKSDQHTDEYGSVAELMDTAKGHMSVYQGGDPDWRPDWMGDGVRSFRDVELLAVKGWTDREAQAYAVASSAIETVTREHDVPTFTPVYDVTGAEPDVALFLSGEPECMVEYQLQASPKAGRVITVVAGICVSAGIDTETVIKRGQAIGGLVLALSRIGLTVELWTDVSTDSGGKRGTVKTMVKGANDTLDMARIMYAVAHPSAMRVLGLAAMHSFPKGHQEALHIGITYGSVSQPDPREYPDGAVILPALHYDDRGPHAERFITDHLRKLGIIND